jgi:hypothetical protein
MPLRDRLGRHGYETAVKGKNGLLKAPDGLFYGESRRHSVAPVASKDFIPDRW